ncbi:TIGR01548 family HAD-type hydrolase [Synechococcus sp. CS-205]|jgi:HAD superfamily phosphatase|uniref:TIGR01548 family HAD-type hydrolase n=1 Tax=Synechococcus sp. CS-205 TaxID=2847984 RepID=UPI00223BC53D|nr:TIGR01548 family HAD-type hydrolase [Synechococcus sp. CS-205]MCT0249414.1 TIGR01548 family HAD-type hydrolase [Synechococcus sp. CS-205]
MVSALKAKRQTTNVPASAPASLQPRAVLLFDIDGVIRDVSGSYRRAIAETVHHFGGWRPEPGQIDALKAEGRWNNDWQASLELLRRRDCLPLPTLEAVVEVFSSRYFGGDPDGDPAGWIGYIREEPLLVEHDYFQALEQAGIAWGFVSGAEPPSCRYVLRQRLQLEDPPLIAMGEAPDKPDPTGLLQLALKLGSTASGEVLPVAYLGDTVADVDTVMAARHQRPDLTLLSLAVAPPHLQGQGQSGSRRHYEQGLRAAGADRILSSTSSLEPELLLDWLGAERLSAPSPPEP